MQQAPRHGQHMTIARPFLRAFPVLTQALHQNLPQQSHPDLICFESPTWQNLSL